ncbi:hypothetical protein EV361DRAFT_865797 [Lentinula raphanica]|nr:hypothetical protein EV361DRAFT_865797 [Lentinula raphanica]
MGFSQWWTLLNPDDRQGIGNIGYFSEFFWYDNWSNIVDYLMTPILPSIYESDPTSLGKSIEGSILRNRISSSPTSTTTIVALPLELLLLIIEDLAEDYLHLLSFSLTCSLLWEISAQARYHSLFTRLKRQSWAGSRVILLGSDAEWLPKTMVFSEKDKRELDLDGPRNTHGECLRNSVDCLFRFPNPGNINVLKPDNGWPKVVEPRNELDKELLAFCDLDEKRFKHWIWYNWRDFKPRPRKKGDRWIVRNFTKREYVTKATTKNLTQVVYSLIGWATSESTDRDDFLSRGRWAGDRMDITLVSTHKREHGKKSGWKDITASVKGRLREFAYSELTEKDYSSFGLSD